MSDGKFENKNLRIIKRPTVQAMTGLSRSSIYQKMKDGDFPQQIKLSERSVGWIESEVQTWLNDRISTSRGGVSHE